MFSRMQPQPSGVHLCVEDRLTHLDAMPPRKNIGCGTPPHLGREKGRYIGSTRSSWRAYAQFRPGRWTGAT